MKKTAQTQQSTIGTVFVMQSTVPKQQSAKGRMLGAVRLIDLSKCLGHLKIETSIKIKKHFQLHLCHCKVNYLIDMIQLE